MEAESETIHLFPTHANAISVMLAHNDSAPQYHVGLRLQTEDGEFVVVLDPLSAKTLATQMQVLGGREMTTVPQPS